MRKRGKGFLEPAPLFSAGHKGAICFFGSFDVQYRRAALGANAVVGFIQGGKSAFWILIAGIKLFAFFRSLFHQGP